MSKKKRAKRRQHVVPKKPSLTQPLTDKSFTPQPKGAAIIDFKVGDSVVVKPGVQDPDFGMDIGGWQGRITDVGPSNGDVVLTIQWNSVTLQSMPTEMIEQCEEDGLGWTVMNLLDCEVEPAAPRDSEQAVARVTEQVANQHAWDWLGPEGKQIREVLAGTDPDDIMEMLHAWEKHLTNHLIFPFDAEVSEFQDRGLLRAGDRVKVIGISAVDDLYGVIVHLRVGRRTYDFPLCDLEAADERSPNHDLVQEYAVWFANR